MKGVVAPTRHELKGTVLLVCSGNICRSPAAAALLIEALGSLPVQVQSGGLVARDGLPLESKMAQALAHRVDPAKLDRFRSRRVDAEMLTEADLVLTATCSQRADVVRLAPPVVRSTFTLVEFAQLAADVAAMVERNGEASPHTISDFVSLVPQVRGTRRLKGSLDIGDPMGRSARTHARVARHIDSAVSAISHALRPTG